MRADQYVHIVRETTSLRIVRIDASYKNLVERCGFESTLGKLDKSETLAKLKAGLTISFTQNGMPYEMVNFKLQSVARVLIKVEAPAKPKAEEKKTA